MKLRKNAYTLIEVLAAAAIVAVGAGAAASLSASVSLQEEFSRRVAVVRNYQENMAQLWQLGMDPVDIMATMPTTQANRFLRAALFGTAQIIPQGQMTVGAAPNTATVETAVCRASVNIARNPTAFESGSPFDLAVCRPPIRPPRN